jgi:hydrogenase expression/formation protein HypC
MQVVESGTGVAWCEGRGQRQQVDMILVGDQLPGTWVLAFNGAARRVIDADEAAQTAAALAALDAAFAGAQNFDAFFADIIEHAAARAEREEGSKT